jgi:hypothetical protein
MYGNRNRSRYWTTVATQQPKAIDGRGHVVISADADYNVDIGANGNIYRVTMNMGADRTINLETGGLPDVGATERLLFRLAMSANSHTLSFKYDAGATTVATVSSLAGATGSLLLYYNPTEDGWRCLLWMEDSATITVLE